MRRLVLLLVLAGLACAGDRGPAAVVTDSSGVRVTSTPLSPRRFAEVDPEPVLSLGGPSASGPTLFSRVQGVYLDPEERLWVADGQSSELRIFGGDGSHWKTRGGRGGGPGEFLRMRMLGAFRGDSVAISDDSNQRLTIFDAAGEPVRTAQLPSIDDTRLLAQGVFEDGSVLALVPRILMVGANRLPEVLADTVRLVRADLREGVSNRQLQGTGGLWLWNGRSQIPMPFTTRASYVADGAAIHFTSGPNFTIERYEGGQLTEKYGVEREARSVTQSDLTAYLDFVEEYRKGSIRTDYLSALDHPARPESLPGYSSLIVASDGRVWARVYSSDPNAQDRWDVFGPSRVWLGEVVTPPRFTVFSIVDGSLAGVWRDAFDVEYVRIYRLKAG